MNDALLDLLVKHAYHRIREAEAAAVLELSRWYDLKDDDLGKLHDAVWKEMRRE